MPYTVMIVEDERPMLKALDLKLQSSGYNTVCARNGREALEFLKEKKIDLVLLDIIMPELDGFGVLAEMKKKGMKMPVIVTSNLGQAEDVKKAKSLGAVDFLIKSDTPILKIVQAVKEHLG